MNERFLYGRRLKAIVERINDGYRVITYKRKNVINDITDFTIENFVNKSNNIKHRLYREAVDKARTYLNTCKY